MISHNLIYDNISVLNGAGIFATYSSTVTIINNTVVNNECTSTSTEAKGGGICVGTGNSSFSGQNNIIYYNSSYNDPEIYGTVQLTYSCVSTGLAGTGNISNSPEFLDLIGGDLNLHETSPCIDAGDPNSPLDPDGTTADMGALFYDHGLGVNSDNPLIQPSTMRLSAYPNPFNPVAVIRYQLPVMSYVSLIVYDISGRLVTELANGWQDTGEHEAIFDGSDLASGIYIYRLSSGDQAISGKTVLMK
ncbi:hypothetical protein CEE37_10335 [candidate division LCP-89 bacterium B3_LCP]|uniref:Secretion system C-terminal sorting domain-containing protein n=1 Tax=candidate division LCP-89 bacterium B3_LCP TaxID=2012998 RepID=A0A532UYT5_UNCL8|nr:MAG: hypothetical protein CEE37_10335 [candidate division LCP-89 bacterium B3_LCP]